MSIGVSIRLPFETRRQRGHRRRPEARLDEVLLHPQADADQGVARRSCACPAASARSTRPSSCSPSCRRARPTPAPIVLLDVPDGTYWTHWREFVVDELAGRGLIVDAGRRPLPRHRRRRGRVRRDRRLLLELPLDAVRRRSPRDPACATARCQDDRDARTTTSPTSRSSGGFDVIAPLPEEIEDDDRLDKARIAFRFSRNHFARLRALIDALQPSPLRSTSSGSRRIEIAFSTPRRARLSRRSSTGSSVPPASMDSRRRTIARSASSSAIASSRARMSSNSPAIERLVDDLHRMADRDTRCGEVQRAAWVRARHDVGSRPDRSRRPSALGSRLPSPGAAPSTRHRHHSTAPRRRARRSATYGCSTVRTDRWARCTWRRWHGSWTATRRDEGSAGRGSASMCSASHSCTSWTRAEKASASGVLSRWP